MTDPVSSAIACLEAFTEAFNARDPAGMDAQLHFPHLQVQDRKHSLHPDFFDPARAKTDIQFLVARVRIDSATGSALGKGRLHPMSAVGQLSAAAFLTPWRTLVDEANGPASPRAG